MGSYYSNEYAADQQMIAVWRQDLDEIRGAVQEAPPSGPDRAALVSQIDAYIRTLERTLLVQVPDYVTLSAVRFRKEAIGYLATLQKGESSALM